MKCLATACALLGLTACGTVPFERFPAYECAVRTPARGTLRCFDSKSTDASKLPQLVPFAVITAPYNTHREYAARMIGREAEWQKLYPEVVMLWDGESYYAGSVTAAAAVLPGSDDIEFDSSEPKCKLLLVGVCCRLAPVRLGIHWDDAGIIMAIEDTARGSGIEEGDKIVSIANAPVLIGAKWMQSPHYLRLLQLQADTQVRLVWTRPGTGRSEGLLTLVANPLTFLGFPGGIEMSSQPQVTNHL
jgi:hypothetical protein